MTWLVFIAASVATALVAWAMGAFVSLSPDPSQWSYDVRVNAALGWALFGNAVALMVATAHSESR